MTSIHNRELKKTTLAAAFALPLVVASYHASADALKLEEVIVTAQKRSESLQDIPSTVNVISGDALKEFNVLSFTDLGELTAGLRIDALTGRSGRIVLRGIDFNPNSAAESSVTTYWNQAIVDSNAVFQQMFDIERIEVLRGPQGTLAGRTSPAGAINIHTARPNMEEIDGEIRGSFADNDGANTQVAASLPLMPGELAVRVAGVYDQSDLDEIQNDVNGETSNTETKAGRFSLSWLPTDRLSANLAVQYLKQDLDNVGVLEGIPSGDPKQDPNGELRSLDAYDRRGASVGIDGVSDNTNADFWNSSLVLDWELESHTITSVTGYQDTDSTRDYDQAQGNANPENVQRIIAKDNRTDWSQEIRFASDGSDTWDYMLGAYYEHSDVTFSQENNQIPISPLAPGSVVLEFLADVDRWGVFSHNQFYLTNEWSLLLGLRYQEVEVDRDLTVVAGPNGISAAPPGFLLEQVLSPDNQHYEDDSATGQITLQYDVHDDLNLYGLVGTSWRPGGVTVTNVVLPEDQLLFDSEDSISYELGFKSTLMDGAMRVNGSLYYQDFKDYISRINALNIRGLDGEIETSGLTVNGDAEVYGAELDMTAILSDNWQLGGSLSYSKGEYAGGTELPCNEFDSSGAPVIPVGQDVVVCDVSGDPIGSVPDWTASINSEYSIPLDVIDGGEGYGRILYTYTGERDADIDDVDPYNIVNLYLGVRTQSWSVELFSSNVFDEEALRGGGGTVNTPLVRREPTGYGQRFPVASRRIGLAASYRF